jgi:hypothetical protein
VALAALLAALLVACEDDEGGNGAEVCQILFAENSARYAIDRYRVSEDTRVSFSTRAPDGQVFYLQPMLDEDGIRAHKIRGTGDWQSHRVRLRDFGDWGGDPRGLVPAADSLYFRLAVGTCAMDLADNRNEGAIELRDLSLQSDDGAWPLHLSARSDVVSFGWSVVFHPPAETGRRVLR